MKMQNPKFNKIIEYQYILIFIFCSVFGLAGNSKAATLYMGQDEDYTNLQAAMAAMQSGDTLIIRDGTYVGDFNMITSTQKPPSGPGTGIGDAQFTVIKAEHDGAVVFDGEYVRNMATIHSCSYIKYEGIIWGRSTENAENAVVSIGSSNQAHHIWMSKCGVFDGGEFDTSDHSDSGDLGGREDGFNIFSAHHILLEDCFAYGNLRYAFYANGANAQQIVFRRCVARIDSSNTDTGIAGFFAYNADFVDFQNCISIDMSNSTSYYLADGEYAASQIRGFYVKEISDTVNFKGCIALNIPVGYPAMSASNSSTTNIIFSDCAFWDSYGGPWFMSDNIGINHCTVGDTVVDGIYSEHGDEAATDSIIYGVESGYAMKTADSWSDSDHNCLFGNTNNYSAAVTPGNNDITNVDPLLSALRHLPRIEAGSELNDTGSSGDIGANILYQIGADGTFYGDDGYATITASSLWPFAEEDLIKTKMAAYTGSNGITITGARGFAASDNGLYGGPITLTSYIWEYLGNECPEDICDYEIDTTAPSSPSGLLVS